MTARWKLSTLGISPNFSYAVTINAGQQAPNVILPPRTYSYAEIYDTYERHWGVVDKWDTAGYVGEDSFDFSVPRAPGWGIRMVTPLRIDDRGSGGNGGG